MSSDILDGRTLSLAQDGNGVVLSPPPGFPGIDYSGLELAMLAQEQAEWESTHEIADGLYLRRTRIPAGVVVLGRKHRKPCINLLLEGSVILFAPSGASTVLNAPRCFTGPAGSQKLAFTLTEIVCANVFAVDGATVDAVEAEVFH